MLNNLKNRLTNGWNLMRLIRLALALAIMAQALAASEVLFALLGGFLLFQAVFNYGCCGADGCDINPNNRQDASSCTTDDGTTFKEVK